METVIILTFIFGLLAGIGGVCNIIGSMLQKRNNFGDSHADARMYTQQITYTDCSEKKYPSEKVILEYVESHAPRKATFPTAPRGNALVESPKTRR